MAIRKDRREFKPLDADIGDEVDIQATAQTITSQEIQAAIIGPEPERERLDNLLRMKAELDARMQSERGVDLLPLVREIEHAIGAIVALRGGLRQS